jgi:pyridoxamine 5'-phosphate oxidase
MVLCTVGADGQPSSRIVYLRGFDDRGFVWFTNYQSRKGQEAEAHPRAALNFFWAPHGRQVRIEGRVERVSEAESEAYFAGRPRESQIGAWASQQSRPLPAGRSLEQIVGETAARFGQGPVPRPPHWGGYRLIPDTLEMWRMGAFRLHERDQYRKTTDGWARVVLFP